MSTLREWFLRLRSTLRPRRGDADLHDELRSHLEMAEDDVRRQDHSAEAQRIAILRYGGVAQASELMQDQRGLPWLRDLAHDVSHAARSFSRSPGFTMAVLAIVGLGVGATTAAFAVVNAVVLQPLPYAAPNRLVRVWDTNATRNLTDFPASVANFRSWQEESRLFEALGAWRYGYATLANNDQPQRVALVLVTRNLLSLLGLRPLAGRDLLAAEDQAGGDTAVIISQGLWEQKYAGRLDAIGQTITLDGTTHTIVGIAPPALATIAAADVWKPMADHGRDEARSLHWLRVIGRLRPDVSLRQAQSEMDLIAARLAQRFPRSNKDWGVRLQSFREWIVPTGIARSLVVLMCAVVSVLLIASANLASLFLVRAMTRAREMAVRTALGAGLGRLTRQLLAESLLIVSAGSAAGIVIATGAINLVRTSSSAHVPRMQEVTIDGWTLLFTIGTAVCIGLAVSLLPLWRLRRLAFHRSMKDRSATGPTGRARIIQDTLVVAQLSLSVVLLVASAQFVDVFLRLTDARLGFHPARVQTFYVALPGGRYPDTATRAAFHQALTERIAALPGVEAVAPASAVPFGPAVDRLTTRVSSPDSPTAVREEPLSVERFSVGADFFRTIATPLVSGRSFSASDTETAAPVAIVSETAAHRLWPDEDPIGKTLVWNRQLTVVGVASDITNVQFDQLPQPAMYLPVSQEPLMTTAYVVRTPGQASGLMAAIRDALRSIDPELPLFGAQSLDSLLERASAQPRLNAGLMGLFAAAALLLAAIGIHGLTAYTVSRRRREFGLRMALGARPSEVQWLVLRLGAKLTVLGIVVGGMATLVAARVLSKLMYGVRPADPFIFSATVVVLCSVGLIACWLPARRVAGIDPAMTLRED